MEQIIVYLGCDDFPNDYIFNDIKNCLSADIQIKKHLNSEMCEGTVFNPEVIKESIIEFLQENSELLQKKIIFLTGKSGKIEDVRIALQRTGIELKNINIDFLKNFIK